MTFLTIFKNIKIKFAVFCCSSIKMKSEYFNMITKSIQNIHVFVHDNALQFSFEVPAQYFLIITSEQDLMKLCQFQFNSNFEQMYLPVSFFTGFYCKKSCITYKIISNFEYWYQKKKEKKHLFLRFIFFNISNISLYKGTLEF